MTHSNTCFVIMPFGVRKDTDGVSVDFDTVYRLLIKPVVESLGMDCDRCDQNVAGLIHPKMFEEILESSIALVDISTLNPNVFYELGVRHALHPTGTILIRRAGTQLPFNIHDVDVIEYDVVIDAAETAKKKISDAIQNARAMGRTDSPVHQHLKLAIMRPEKRLDDLVVYDYALKGHPTRKLGIMTGNLRNVGRGTDAKKVDVWVNSENTNMQMARYFDRSISSVIRYEGARKDAGGSVIEDTVYEELAAQVQNLKIQEVQPGTVLVTEAGELSSTCGVRRIFHVATVRGEVGHGYSAVTDLGGCVLRALEMMDADEFAGEDLHSILFPLLGTGTARAEKHSAVRTQINAAVKYMAANSDSTVNEVYFLAWSDVDLEICQSIIQQRDDLGI